MRRPFFIVGPTATGKSDMAAEVAARCGGEIVGADAYQLYEGLASLTAKPSPETLARVRHHLIGCVPVAEEFSAARYLESAQAALSDIAQRGRPAIVVGGSGLYVKALTHGLAPLPPAQPELRAELDALDADTLHSRLHALDPAAAETVDRQNKRRMVRALEVCLTTGGRFSEHRALWSNPADPADLPYGVLLVRDREALRGRIDQRVESMFSQGAVFEEVRAAAAQAPGSTAARIIGFAEIRAFLDGALSRRDCMERIKTATRQYAKRQMTWFKREQVFATFHLSETDDVETVISHLTDAAAIHARRERPDLP